MKRLHKLLALLLLLTLPVQGMAAAYAPVHMLQGMQAAADMPCHSGAMHADDSPVAGDQTHHNSGSDTSSSSHNCCHQVFSCVPSVEIHTATRKPGDVPQTVLLLHTLFVPDSPYRPPRG